MSGISSLGIGSGIDLNSLVDGLVNAERATAEGPLNRNQFRAETRLSALGSLKSAVGRLATALEGLAGFQVQRKATSSDDSVVTATVTADAEPGSYTIDVQQLATAQSLASSALAPFAGMDEIVGEGSLTLTVGDETVVIDIADGANTLTDVRDAINASDADVQAVVVNNGSGYRLLLTSNVTGTAGAMTLTVGGSLDGRLASADMDETVAAQDASFRINGLEIVASSNELDDVLPGVTLELRGDSEGGATTLTVAPDKDALRSKLEALVVAYNGLVDNMSASGQRSVDGGAAGPLVGDAALRTIQTRLGGAFSETIDLTLASGGGATDGANDGATGGAQGSAPVVGDFSNLVSIGLQTDVNGKARLDVEKLTAALEQDEDGVASLVSAFAAGFGETLTAFSGADGILSSRTTQLDAELRRIRRQRDVLEQRMDQVESRLRAQFAALDTLVSQFQSTSAYLAQQLTSLASLQPKGE